MVPGNTNQLLNIEVRFNPTPFERNRLVCLFGMQGMTIIFSKHCQAGDAHIGTGLSYTDGNFTAVGNEHPVEYLTHNCFSNSVFRIFPVAVMGSLS